MTEKADTLKAAFYKRRAIWIERMTVANDMTPFARVLGIWIAHKASYESQYPNYKISTMADILAVEPRTIMRAIKELEGYRKDHRGKWQLIASPRIIVRRDSARGRKTASNRYELVFWWL